MEGRVCYSMKCWRVCGCVHMCVGVGVFVWIGVCVCVGELVGVCVCGRTCVCCMEEEEELAAVKWLGSSSEIKKLLVCIPLTFIRC